VGDSQADLVMVDKANSLGVLFAGVYGYTSKPESVCHDFLEQGADIVAPTVNELPFLFEKLMDEK
jgi:hypothetical protein